MEAVKAIACLASIGTISDTELTAKNHRKLEATGVYKCLRTYSDLDTYQQGTHQILTRASLLRFQINLHYDQSGFGFYFKAKR